MIGTMWRIAAVLCCLLPATLPAAERWTKLASPPFIVWTEGNDRPAREALTTAVQLRHVLGVLFDVPEMPSVWPIHLYLRKQPMLGPIRLGRAAWVLEASATEALPSTVKREIARLLIEQNVGRLPAAMESALLSLYSLLEVEGTRVTLGAAPAPNQQTPEWVLLHMLSTDPAYSGKVRVFVRALARGVDLNTASRNAFQIEWQQVQAQAQQRGMQAATTSLSGKPISPEQAFPDRRVEGYDTSLVTADLLFLQQPTQALSQYRAMAKSEPARPEAHEGVALLNEQNQDEARQAATAAQQADSRNARLYVRAAALAQPAEARGHLQKAATLNERWDEPHIRLAALAATPQERAHYLQAAADRNRRNPTLWQALAEALDESQQFTAASKAWGMAEQQSDEAQREALRQLRARTQERRIEQEAADKRRLAEEQRRELEQLKNESLARIRAAEAKSRQDGTPLGEVIDWPDEEAGTTVEGTLRHVACQGNRLRLTVATAKGTTILHVPDVQKLQTEGGSAAALTCGAQKQPRRIMATLSKPSTSKASAVVQRIAFP